MSIDHSSSDAGSQNFEEWKPSFEIEHNKHGPWAKMEDEEIKSHIFTMARENHFYWANEDTEHFGNFPQFLDAFAAAWIEIRAKIHEIIETHGFTECESSKDIMNKSAAIICFTHNGSLVLLGNNCLKTQGGSARYEKNSFRINGAPQQLVTPYGVRVRGNIEVKRPVLFDEQGSNFLDSTSQVRELYYTNEQLPPEAELMVATALSKIMTSFSETVTRCATETVKSKPEPKKDNEEPAIPREPDTAPLLDPLYM